MLLVAALMAIAAATIVIFANGGGQPAEASGAAMSLGVYADKAKTQPAVCDGGKCAVDAGTAFSIDVIASSPPPDGYIAYQVTVQYSGAFTLQQQQGFGAANRWSECVPFEEEKTPGRYRIQCMAGDPNRHYTGTLVNVQFQCDPEGGSGQIDLLGVGPAKQSSYYFRTSIFGSLVFPKSQDKGGKQVADSVVINCVRDFDGDGCTNDQELGPDPNEGGQRDPYDYWDFFDTPHDASTTLSANVTVGATPPFDITVASTPTFPVAPSTLFIDGEKFAYDATTATTFHITDRALDGTTADQHDVGADIVSNVRDRAVNITDILRVARRFGQNDLGKTTPINRNTDPLSPAPPTGLPKPQSYHPAYDRGTLVGPNRWDLAPADGAITILDILNIAAQFGHSCAPSPEK